VSVSVIFVVIGQVLQVVAGFILSVEVIGLKRVDRWSRWLSILHKDVTTDDARRRFFSLRRQIPAIFTATGTMVITAINVQLMRRWGLDQNWTWFVWIGVVSGAGALVTATVYELLMLTLRGTARGLRAIHSRSRARTSGVLGFLLLLLGFLLESGGTIAQVLNK
jgi:uncharacterized membrane protein (DUF2068 family)